MKVSQGTCQTLPSLIGFQDFELNICFQLLELQIWNKNADAIWIAIFLRWLFRMNVE